MTFRYSVQTVGSLKTIKMKKIVDIVVKMVEFMDAVFWYKTISHRQDLKNNFKLSCYFYYFINNIFDICTNFSTKFDTCTKNDSTLSRNYFPADSRLSCNRSYCLLTFGQNKIKRPLCKKQNHLSIIVNLDDKYTCKSPRATRIRFTLFILPNRRLIT